MTVRAKIWNKTKKCEWAFTLMHIKNLKGRKWVVKNLYLKTLI